MAPTLDRIARASRPVIWLLSKSTDVVVRLLRRRPVGAARDAISEEELRDIVAAHETLGREERQLIEDVFEAGDRQLREVMVPRTEVDFLDASMPVYKAVKLSSTNPHSRYPVVARLARRRRRLRARARPVRARRSPARRCGSARSPARSR